MSRILMLTLPDETAAAVAAVAAARGVSVEELVTQWTATTAASESTPASGVRRRRLALSGVGAGDAQLSSRVDEMLADGFGRD